jgi:carboxyl-terminal processing protease
MDKMRKNTLFVLFGAIFVVLVGGFAAEKISAKQDNFYEGVIRFDDILRKIKINYVEDVPVESLIVYGVNGMRDILDPNTNYFEEKEYDNLMIHTKGEFGGLGIHIGMPDNQLTIISPMPIPSSPAMKAGLMAGDRIIKIGGKTTKGLSMDDAVNKLRGPKGTLVTITISRDGVLEPFDVELERAIIKVNSVPFHGIIDEKNKVGYLNLVSFTQVTTNEVQAAVANLIKAGAKSCILDLRGNPGGLLKEAVSVSECFLPKDKLIVYTQGRHPSSKTVFNSSGKVALDPKMPLVVLVNQGSASASEIVAGAIQDHDRGVIMGNETFGKGSVQSILPLDNSRALKLTTAFYYTPSGRCINKLRNDVGSKRHQMESESEPSDDENSSEKDAASTDSSSKEIKKEPYKTLGLGRTVYGSGGINPDIDVVAERVSPVEIELARKSLFFKFASSEVARKKAKDPSFRSSSVIVNDSVFALFMDFLRKQDFKLETPEMRIIDETKKVILRGRKDLADTSKIVSGPNDKNIDKALAEMDSLMVKESEYSFERHKEVLKNRLQMAFLSTEAEQDSYYKFVLKSDRYVNDAIKLLADKKRYETILSPSFKKE